MDISKISRIEIDEICREYERAENHAKQIKISSELHLLKPDMIRAILEAKGYITPQKKNYAKSVTITYNGQTLTIAQWAKETGICKGTIRDRYYKGWTPEAIITTPVKGEINHA